MSRGKVDKLYRTFNKGLITEAGFLTYPEDASTDELNTIIYEKGNRTRRPGIDYEASSTGINVSSDNTAVTSEYFWRAPGNVNNLHFLVTQVKNILFFFDATQPALSSGLKSFTVDLHTYVAPFATTSQIDVDPVSMSNGKGFLFVVGQYIEPILIKYDQTTDTIAVIPILIQLRDFDGVNDSLANDAEPTTLSDEHHYNLLNQGWVTPGSQTTTTTDPSTGGSDVYYDPYTGTYRQPLGGEIP